VLCLICVSNGLSDRLEIIVQLPVASEPVMSFNGTSLCFNCSLAAKGCPSGVESLNTE